MKNIIEILWKVNNGDNCAFLFIQSKKSFPSKFTYLKVTKITNICVRLWETQVRAKEKKKKKNTPRN